jgi:hypothetical protein
MTMNQSMCGGKAGMEHRWGDRRRVILRLRLYGPDESSAIGWLTDISLSGAYVRTLTALPLMSRIDIEVDELNSGGTRLLPLQLRGRVVRHGPTGIGVEWEEFASRTLREIVRIGASIHQHRLDHTLEGMHVPGLWTATTHGPSNEKRSCIES